MRYQVTLLAALAVVGFSTASAQPAHSGSSVADTALSSAAAPAPAAPLFAGPAASPIAPPSAGKAQVVFFRSGALMGWASNFDVRENNVHIGELSNGAYFVCSVDPGKHTFTASSGNKDSLTLEIDEGETYYVKGSPSLGFSSYEANIALSDEATFRTAFKHLHHTGPD